MLNANSPAHPCTQPMPYDPETGQYNPIKHRLGLTKREYFAGLAMQAIAAKGARMAAPIVIATNAIELADTLLKMLGSNDPE